MSEDRIVYRGVRVTKDWPERIRQEQNCPTCKIKGAEQHRVRYGSETDDWGANSRPCHDCAVIKGELHVLGCDVERCPLCGGQLIGCECDD